MRRLRVKMSSSTPDGSVLNKTRAAVLTVSDSCSRGEKTDLSGPAVAEALGRRNFQVVARGVVADEPMSAPRFRKN
jgi:molybdopterin biosynthesis enzyme MoaB